MQYTTYVLYRCTDEALCYQDFKDTFVCNTQLEDDLLSGELCCVIRISKILLYAIHNIYVVTSATLPVVLSGFQRYFCMQYTTVTADGIASSQLCYQDFKDTFVCNTQLKVESNNTRIVVLSGFQRYFCMQYTTSIVLCCTSLQLCYQDFKDTFVCNTQRTTECDKIVLCCVIRISKILLYAIHNRCTGAEVRKMLCYQDFKDTFVCNTQPTFCSANAR